MTIIPLSALVARFGAEFTTYYCLTYRHPFTFGCSYFAYIDRIKVDDRCPQVWQISSQYTLYKVTVHVISFMKYFACGLYNLVRT